MDAKELRDKTPDQLRDELVKLKKEAFNLRFQQAGGTLENTARMRVVRRDAARVMTILNEKAAAAADCGGLIDMPKRILSGTVTSDQNEQTVTVSVERRFKHPLLHKTVRKSKKYRAHDAGEPIQGRRQRPHPGMRADLEDETLGGCDRLRR